MEVTFGLKTHSGWDALVALGRADNKVIVVDRRRIELVDEEWARQPYHGAENLKPDAARDLVKRGIAAAKRIATRELRAALKRERARENNVTAVALLIGSPMPDWNTHEILAVHFRMHKAEGVLFRDALMHAAKSCAVKLIAIPEKELIEQAESVLKKSQQSLENEIATLGKSVGSPWGKDQKDAALAALIALG